MKALLKKVLGDESSRAINKIKPIVKEINNLEPEFEAMSDIDLRAQTDIYKQEIIDGKTLDEILPRAYATVREVTKRVRNQRHYDVQLIGGIMIHQGKIAEMRTGEGKTLTATLPVYLNALSGKGVHVVTVNDYLARREVAWMGEIYHHLGLTISGINSQETSFLYDPNHEEADADRDEHGDFKIRYEFLRPCDRYAAYAADVVYGTNSEFGFDYLRDNLEYDPGKIRQKHHTFAIIDEVDSILIDEARTPLIISAPAADSDDLYRTFANIAKKLVVDEDYTVDEKKNAVQVTDSGIDKAEKELNIDNIYTDKGIKYVHHLENAVRAKALYKKDDKYVIQGGEVVIVDSFTGRLQPGRRWSSGLHQAVEAKEGVSVQQESRTVASITYQNYFRMYDKLSGMTGTAATSAEEFFKVYSIDTVVIPTHRPIARIDNNDLVFATEHGKFLALSKKIKEIQETGQPVLIGTVSVEKNELLSEYFTKAGITHEVLNAKNHEREGQIVADAGQKGHVTIATNMAGRGVDIKLGGPDATVEEEQAVKDLGGLYVVGTERHEARRIDNQLRGRSGRQGDPGETQFYVSGEDPLIRMFAKDRFKAILQTFNFAEDEAIQAGPLSRMIENAQTQIEGLHFDSRKSTLDYDDVLNQQRTVMYTERRKLLLNEDEFVRDLLAEMEEEYPDNKEVTEKRRKELGDEVFFAGLRQLYLQTTDSYWMEHIDIMDSLRSSVNLRSYGQREPVVEYKREGLAMFKQLRMNVREQVVNRIEAIGQSNAIAEDAEKVKQVFAQAQAASQSTGDGAVQQPVRKAEGEMISRNDKVTIRHMSTGESQEVKFKNLHKYTVSGWKLIGKAK